MQRMQYIPRDSRKRTTPEQPDMDSGASSSSSTQSAPLQRKFDYFLILDFEATCDSNRSFHPPEIIEFPVVLLNASTLKIEDEYAKLCLLINVFQVSLLHQTES